MTHAERPAPRALAWASPLTILLLLLVLAFLLLGLRGLLAPGAAAASLGVLVADPGDLALMQAVGARNIGLALLGLALVVQDSRAAMGWLLLAGAAIAGLDFWVVASATGVSAAMKHLAYVALLGGVGLATLSGRGSQHR